MAFQLILYLKNSNKHLFSMKTNDSLPTEELIYVLLRAVQQNFRAGKLSVVAVPSACRLSVYRKGKSRAYFEKLIEILLATRLELRYTKGETRPLCIMLRLVVMWLALKLPAGVISVAMFTTFRGKLPCWPCYRMPGTHSSGKEPWEVIA